LEEPQEVLHSTDDYGRELRYLAFLQTLCAKTALSCGESASDYFGYNEKLVWSSDPAEAAAQICLIHYDNADGDIWTVNTTALAARLGQPHALKFLHENGCPWDETTCSSAASKGHLSCLQYAHENGCGWDAETGTEATRNGHLPSLKYACENGCPTDVESLSRSMWHTACFDYLRKNGFLAGAARLCASAARTNNLALLMKLHSKGCQWDERTCEAATQASSLECLQYAHENGCPWDSKTCSEAIQHANTDCLRYAVEQECPLAADILCHAALYLPCLEYLHERSLAWHKEVCEQAAFLGRVECLVYAHEHGCPWDARTCESAANFGRLGALRYAHEHGCPWDARTVNAAAERGKDSCLQYALAHGCPANHTTCTRAAASNLCCLILAHEHGCPWKARTFAAAAKAGNLECLRYLFGQGCPWEATACVAAAREGKLDCLRYLCELGCPWVVSQLLAIPLTVKTRRCLEYVREQAPAEAAAYDANVLALQTWSVPRCNGLPGAPGSCSVRKMETITLAEALKDFPRSVPVLPCKEQPSKVYVRQILSISLSDVLAGTPYDTQSSGASLQSLFGPSRVVSGSVRRIKCDLLSGSLSELLSHRAAQHSAQQTTAFYSTPIPDLQTGLLDRAPSSPADVEASTRPPETRHQRHVRRWREKQTRLAQARGQQGGKEVLDRKTGKDKTGAGRRCRQMNVVQRLLYARSLR
jgi:hypothetical protein